MVNVKVAGLAAAIIFVVVITSLFLLTTPRQEPLLLTTQTTTTQATSPQATQATTTQAKTQPNIISLTLYLNDYGYNASKGGPKITVFVGDVVRIRLVGNGSGPVVHDFTLDEKSPSPYNVKSDRLRRGQEQVIEFTARIPGVYKYYCSVTSFAGPSHRERGQEGVIEIMSRG